MKMFIQPKPLHIESFMQNPFENMCLTPLKSIMDSNPQMAPKKAIKSHKNFRFTYALYSYIFAQLSSAKKRKAELMESAQENLEWAHLFHVVYFNLIIL